MQQIDTNKIKTMTSDRIAYTLYERNRIMKKKKLKKALFSVVVCILLLGGITTVDALSQGKISNTLKNTVKVILIGDDNQKREMEGEYYEDTGYLYHQHELEEGLTRRAENTFFI